MNAKKRIYLDYAATTPVLPEVALLMQTVLLENFGNPSSLHAEGRTAKALLHKARETLAKSIGAEIDEIFFTSGATESNALALFGIAKASRKKGKHIITSSIEHSSVLGNIKMLEEEGFRITLLPPNPDGIIEPDTLGKAIQKETILISIMTANNEIGTIQPILELSAIARMHQIPFHTDAAQAFGYLPIHVKTMSISAMSLSAHKIYGPKGIGALFLKRGTPFTPVFKGGEQEREVRPGTENVAGIAGFAKAAEILFEQRDKDTKRILPLRNKLRDGLLSRVSDLGVNGHPEKRLPNNVNITFRHADGESILIHLDMEGIACSMGSACSAGALLPSHVLLALGRTPQEAKSSIRFTLGKFTTEEEIDEVLEILTQFVRQLRTISSTSHTA